MRYTNSYRSMFDLIDDIFNDAFNAIGSAEQPVRYNKLISSGSFPPTNITVDKQTKVLTIETALAGIKEDEIDLSFEGDYLKLKVDVKDKVGDKEVPPKAYLQMGLKRLESLETKWAIDPRFYSRDDVSVTFENGLLTIVIQPKEDVKPKQLRLFGKLEPKAEAKQVEDKTTE